jgi:hypothetical protein
MAVKTVGFKELGIDIGQMLRLMKEQTLITKHLAEFMTKYVQVDT